MSFPCYPNYKDSNVEWLGQIPDHWRIQRLSSICDFQPGKAHEPFIDDEGAFICVNSRFVSTEGESRKFCSQNLSPARKNDILMVMSDLPNGRALAKAYFVGDDGPYAVNQRVCILSPRKGNPRFLFYLLNRNRFFLQHDDGANQTHLPNEVFKKFQAPAPEPSEQTAIAAFLDRETAKIDLLVAEQQRLIDLLKEKRQAMISHAVTKGLNPTAPVKPSGIEWLGHLPADWKVARLGYYAAVENGTTPSRDNSEYWYGGDIPWLTSGEVNQYRITQAQEYIAAPALKDCSLRLLPKGTIVVGMIGQGKTRGLSASLEIEATINQNLAAVVPGPQLNSDYLLYIFQSAYEYLREFGRGGNQAALNCEILSALKIPLPSITEQSEIAYHLSQALPQIDSLISESQRAIHLLQERRTALISASVTGQIDVRNSLISHASQETYHGEKLPP